MCSDVFSNAIVPALTAGVTIFLFWLKFHSDAKRSLDELLLDLEHKLYDSDKRSRIYMDSFPAIRKAYHECQRWIAFTCTKEKFEKAFAEFRGSNTSEEEIRKGMADSPKEQVDTLITSMELCCLTPSQDDLSGFMSRIAELRYFTGSRRPRKGNATHSVVSEKHLLRRGG